MSRCLDQPDSGKGWITSGLTRDGTAEHICSALAYGDVRLGLKYTEFVTNVALKRRCDRNFEF